MPVDFRDPTSYAHNLNALLIGTGEFSFASGATTAAQAGGVGYGYRPFGNVKAFALQPKITTKEHTGAYRGVRSVDKTFTPGLELLYKLTLEEIGLNSLLLALLGSTGTAFTQTVQSAVAGDALVFTSPLPSDPLKWYDIKVAGVQIRDLTALTVTTLVEGTDFRVDYKLGRIQFLAAQTTSRTPTVSAPAITSSDNGYLRAITPLNTGKATGIGRIVCYDQASTSIVVFDHKDFACEVMSGGDTSVGEDVASYDVIVRVLPTLAGTCYVREA